MLVVAMVNGAMMIHHPDIVIAKMILMIHRKRHPKSLVILMEEKVARSIRK